MRPTTVFPLGLALLTACSAPSGNDGGLDATGADAASPDGAATDAPRVDAPVDARASDVRTDVPATDAPAVDAPAMDVPATDVPTTPSCGTDGWITYGHDARRTFATDACVNGPLTMAWRYDPMPAPGHTVSGVEHAIADAQGIYLQWRGANDPYIGTTAVDRVSLTGSRVWTFDSGTDTNIGNWASLWMGSVLVQDDGLYMLDAATGTRVRDTGVDWWGQTAPDPNRLYVVNNAHIDGPGVFVGAVDAMLAPTWQQNQYGMCRIDVTDLDGSIAVDGGTVFYAARYSTGTGVHLPFSSGVYAFDGATGAMHWTKSTTPSGAVSAGDGHVYLIENGDTLVARNQADGGVAWMATVSGASTQAPVLAGGRVIVAGSAGILAFDAATGAPAWTAASISASESGFSISFTGGCAGIVPEGGPVYTSIAAALGSNTLVVTAYDGVHVISLADGSNRWNGTISGAMGRVRNPVPVGDTVYVTDSAGLLALRAM